ncbi:MAG: hypothetical protein M1817_005673 [Caeruleum heppii]|nr:MAG: hypothetical protein M1817_005673 [Caeruleum heppii]
MQVELYVYDLSKGLARQYSTALLGTYIEAVYHTSLVFGGVEYFFGLGRPMEVIPMGETFLPEDVIAEYLVSLKAIYTPESYDLWVRNCNSFSNDFATFLVGKGIPQHITSLPQTVLNTPFGQMLKPQIDQAMRGTTQAPLPPSSALPVRAVQSSLPTGATTNGLQMAHPNTSNGTAAGKVHSVTSLRQLDSLLASAEKTCAVIFFTSASCPPCKLLYPAYDELAAEAGNRATLIKVDVGQAYEIGQKYNVRVTPTIMTFLKGERENEWKGADERQLRSNVGLLLQMAQHPHKSLRLPSLQKPAFQSVTYPKAPPLDKLMAKMGDFGRDPSVVAVKDFVRARSERGAREATLPDMKAFVSFVQDASKQLPPETMFTVVDLLRTAMMDPRFSGYFAEEAHHRTVLSLLGYVNGLSLAKCPYSLRIVTLQMACNLFTSPLYPPQILSSKDLKTPIIQLMTTSILDHEHANVRVAAASLAFNMAASNHVERMQAQREMLDDSDQVEVLASLMEAVSEESESVEALRACLMAMGLVVYCAAEAGEVWDLLKALNAAKTVQSKSKSKVFVQEGLIEEIGGELLGKGVK